MNPTEGQVAIALYIVGSILAYGELRGALKAIARDVEELKGALPRAPRKRR